MKLKKSLLIASLTTLLASTTVYSGDDADGSGKGEGKATNGAEFGDTQTATIKVPEISLIDVTNKISATLEAPTDAGDNFKTISVTEDVNYAISANIAADGSVTTKKIIASSDNIPAGWKFNITMDAPSASGKSTGEQSLTKKVTSVDLVTNIENVANHKLKMAITVGPESPTIMPSYTVGAGRTATIVYTITAG